MDVLGFSASDLRNVLLTPKEALAQRVSGKTKAAVLVPICGSDRGPIAVFTKRRHDLPKHAGEISFPGGRPDPDEEDLQHTALRETEEEIGLTADRVEIVGALPPTGTFITSFAVYPFVGVVEAGSRFHPNPAEVTEVLEFALADLVTIRKKKRLMRKGVPVKSDVYEMGENMIWGATARMLSSLLERIQPLIDRS